MNRFVGCTGVMVTWAVAAACCGTGRAAVSLTTEADAARAAGRCGCATGTPAGRAGPGCTITGSAGRATGCWIARPLDCPAAGAAVATGGMVSDGGRRVLTPTAEERAPGGGGSASLVTAARGAAAI